MSHALLPIAEVCPDTIRLIKVLKSRRGNSHKSRGPESLKGVSIKFKNQVSKKGNSTLVKAEYCATIKRVEIKVRLCSNSLDPLLDRLSSTVLQSK